MPEVFSLRTLASFEEPSWDTNGNYALWKGISIRGHTSRLPNTWWRGIWTPKTPFKHLHQLFGRPGYKFQDVWSTNPLWNSEMSSSRSKKLQGPKCFHGTLKIIDFKENDLKPNFFHFCEFFLSKIWMAMYTKVVYTVFGGHFLWECIPRRTHFPEKISRESRLFGTA